MFHNRQHAHTPLKISPQLSTAGGRCYCSRGLLTNKNTVSLRSVTVSVLVSVPLTCIQLVSGTVIHIRKAVITTLPVPVSEKYQTSAPTSSHTKVQWGKLLCFNSPHAKWHSTDLCTKCSWIMFYKLSDISVSSVTHPTSKRVHLEHAFNSEVSDSDSSAMTDSECLFIFAVTLHTLYSTPASKQGHNKSITEQ